MIQRKLDVLIDGISFRNNAEQHDSKITVKESKPSQ